MPRLKRGKPRLYRIGSMIRQETPYSTVAACAFARGSFATGGELGQSRHQAAGVRVDGRGENLFGWAALDNLTFVQDGDALADSGDRRQIVRDVEDRHADLAIEAGEQFQDFGLRDHVERAGGFIGD